MSRRAKYAVIVGITFALLILAPVLHHYQLRFVAENYLAKLKAQGEPMTLAQVLPPPVPPEKNSVATLQQADASFGSSGNLSETNSVSGMASVVAGKAMIRWQQPDIRDPYETNSWQKVIADVARNENGFELYQQIIQKPFFDLQVNYESGIDGINYMNLGLVPIKNAALRLETAAICELHQGDTVMAVKNLRAILGIIKAQREQRLVISELVRNAITQIGLSVNWEVLQSPNLTDDQLAELQQDWMSLEFMRTLENALAMERVTGEISLTQERSNHGASGSDFSYAAHLRDAVKAPDLKTASDELKTTADLFFWQYWWSYPDELMSLRGYETLLNTLRMADTNGSFEAPLSIQNASLDQLGISRLSKGYMGLSPGDVDYHSMLSSEIVGLARVINRVMTIEAARHLVITAITLKRYHLKHGNYPESLAALTPDLLPSVPSDPVDGKPLRYHRNPDGTFLLYSIGENGRDDGGNPSSATSSKLSHLSWPSPAALDWVWPQPATPAEIQSYYAGLRK